MVMLLEVGEVSQIAVLAEMIGEGLVARVPADEIRVVGIGMVAGK